MGTTKTESRMKSISDIILESFGNNSKGIERNFYRYNMNIAKNVWLGLASQEIKAEVQKLNQTNEVWTNLIKWVFGDKSCIYDLKKAIGLTGGTGTGKTVTMEILRNFILIDDIKYIRDGRQVRLKHNIVSTKNIVGDYMNNGYIAVEKYSSMANLCIDDMGSEVTKAKHFGTELNVIEEIIENRYMKNMLTHFTANYSLEDIGEFYGDRVYSRLKHSCNIIMLNDKDFRL